MPTVEPISTLTRCCDACWHGPDRPCPDVVACRTGGESCHPGCDGKRQDRVHSLRQQNAKQPVIYLGMGTCGLGAGAGKTLAALKTYLA